MPEHLLHAEAEGVAQKNPGEVDDRDHRIVDQVVAKQEARNLRPAAPAAHTVGDPPVGIAVPRAVRLRGRQCEGRRQPDHGHERRRNDEGERIASFLTGNDAGRDEGQTEVVFESGNIQPPEGNLEFVPEE